MQKEHKQALDNMRTGLFAVEADLVGTRQQLEELQQLLYEQGNDPPAELADVLKERNRYQGLFESKHSEAEALRKENAAQRQELHDLQRRFTEQAQLLADRTRHRDALKNRLEELERERDALRERADAHRDDAADAGRRLEEKEEECAVHQQRAEAAERRAEELERELAENVMVSERARSALGVVFYGGAGCWLRDHDPKAREQVHKAFVDLSSPRSVRDSLAALATGKLTPADVGILQAKLDEDNRYTAQLASYILTLCESLPERVKLQKLLEEARDQRDELGERIRELQGKVEELEADCADKASEVASLIAATDVLEESERNLAKRCEASDRQLSAAKAALTEQNQVRRQVEETRDVYHAWLSLMQNQPEQADAGRFRGWAALAMNGAHCSACHCRSCDKNRGEQKGA